MTAGPSLDMRAFPPSWTQIVIALFLVATWTWLVARIWGVLTASGRSNPIELARVRRVRPRWRGGVAFLWLSALCAGVAITLLLAYRKEHSLVSAFADEAARGVPDDAEAIVERYVEFAHDALAPATFTGAGGRAVRLYYRVNPLHPGPGDVVRWGSDFRGPCGSYSRVVHVMLDERGIRNRFLFLTDPRGSTIHTVLEVELGGKWAVVDPSFGIVYRRPGGGYASAAELKADPSLLQWNVRSIEGYDASYAYQSTTHLNWKKVPILLPALRIVLEALLGPERVAEIGRPDLWIWPRLFASLVLAACSVVFALVGWRLERRRASSLRPA